MVACKLLQVMGGLKQRPAKKESERLRKEGKKIKFIDIHFESRKFAGARKGRGVKFEADEPKERREVIITLKGPG